MIPYMFCSIPIYLIIRLIVLRKTNNEINWSHESALCWFVFCRIGLASLTVIPKFEFGVGVFHIIKNGGHATNLIPFKVLFETYYEVFVNKYIDYFLINFLVNIIMFMPIGFFVPLLWQLSNKKVIAIGFCSSLFIEFSQIFLIRGTDIDDLFLNTIGTLLGLLVYRFFYKWFKNFMIKFQI